MLAQNARQPHVIIRDVAIKGDCQLALCRGLAPLLQGELHAAQKVLRLVSAGAGLRQRRQQGDGFVRLAGLQLRIGLSQRRGRNLRACQSCRGRCQACRQERTD
jgi:hypothetical protein